MVPWETVATARVPGSDEKLYLYRRGEEFSIRGDAFELMNSRLYGSEQAMARLSCGHIRACKQPRILIGGLGMGYTLAATLTQIGPRAQVAVAELVPAVVRWNRNLLGHLADHPLSDSRVTVLEMDVALALRQAKRSWDAIVLDVDNGPDGLTRPENEQIYGLTGLSMAHGALKKSGVLAVWSAAPDRAFTKRLKDAGFGVTEHRVAAHGRKKGGRHVIWLGVKGG